MEDRRLQLVRPAPGRWLQDELTAFGGQIGNLVPGSFPAFARILHRIDPDGHAVRWSDVCASSGAVPHGLMQWHLVCRGWTGHDGQDPLRGRNPKQDPLPGRIDPISMAALYSVLAQATAAGAAFHAVWDGWGGIAAAFPGPTLDLPAREYVVFCGPLDPGPFADGTNSTLSGQTPNLSWAKDHSWCVATETDLDSTVVGGAPELIDAILHHPQLEAWPVTAEDSLAFDPDRINRP